MSACTTISWFCKSQAVTPSVGTKLGFHKAVRLMDNHRTLIRALDGCLECLEEASERGLKRVPADLAQRVSTLVPGVSKGLLITQAMELVFQEQGNALPANDGTYPVDLTKNRSVSSRIEPSGALTFDGVRARTLTERIKQCLSDSSLLLLEAHEGSAWRVLGYGSWTSYAEHEFGLSRSRSYELLDHGRVVRALMTAAHLDTLPEISAFAAGQIKSRLSEAVAEITSRVAHQLGDDHARRIVQETVSKMRSEVKSVESLGVNAKPTSLQLRARTSRTTSDVNARFDQQVMADLGRAVDFLTALPEPEQVLVNVSSSSQGSLGRLREAARVLITIADAWDRMQVIQTAGPERPSPEFRTVRGVINGRHGQFRSGVDGARAGKALANGAHSSA